MPTFLFTSAGGQMNKEPRWLKPLINSMYAYIFAFIIFAFLGIVVALYFAKLFFPSIFS